MLQSYEDIMAIAARAGAEVRWHDDNGVPRFADHHPNLCPDIYADEVALLEIACQSCERRFRVQVSQSRMDAAVGAVRTGGYGPAAAMLEEALGLARVTEGRDDDIAKQNARVDKMERELAELRSRRFPSLADQIRNGSIHYGDPPSVGCCAAGDTMNCVDLRVLEYWTRGRVVTGPLEDAIAAMEWHRLAELEIDLPRDEPG